MPDSLPPSAAANDFATADRAESPRVVVLGASGFIGRHVTAKLREASVEPIAVARRAVPEFDAAIDLVEAPQKEIEDLVRQYQPTAVINCSGAVRGSAEQMMRGNLVAIDNLLSALAKITPQARLVQLGSSAEYGAPDSEVPMSEGIPAKPSSPYGYSKLAATELVLRARSEGATATVLRIFNVSGPHSPTSTMLGGLVAKLQTTDRITLDSLDGWRDYVDVRDIAEAAIKTALAAGEVPPVINIGSGEAVRTGDWVKQLIDASGTGAQLEERRDTELIHKASVGQVAWQCADISLARRSLAWSPSFSLTTSLRDTWLAATSS